MTEERTELKEAKQYNGEIGAIDIISNRFVKAGEEAAYEVRIRVECADGYAYLYLDMRNEYPQFFTSELTQLELSMEALERLGLPDGEIAQIDKLVGTKISIYGKESKKGGVNYYISNKRVEVVDTKSAAADIAALLGKSDKAVMETDNDDDMIAF